MDNQKMNRAAALIALEQIRILRLKIEKQPKINIKRNINIGFRIGTARKIQVKKKLIMILMDLSILCRKNKNDNNPVLLCNLTSEYQYKIKNFKEVFKKKENKKIEAPVDLVRTFMSISLSTARGILFSKLQNTYLEGTILPITDPMAFLIRDNKLGKTSLSK